MKVGIRQGVCYDSPAECDSPENGWRSSMSPILCQSSLQYDCVRGRGVSNKALV